MHHNLNSGFQIDGATVHRDFLGFFVRRYFRIVPAYIVALLAATWTTSGMSVVDWLCRLTFIFGFFQSTVNSGVPDWSLTLEMQFYVAVPWIVLAIRRFGFFWPAFVMAVITFAANLLFGSYTIDPPGLLGRFDQPSFLPLQLSVFGMGMAISHLLGTTSAPRFEIKYLMVVIIGAAGFRHGHSRAIMFGGALVCGALIYPHAVRLRKKVYSWLCALDTTSLVQSAANYSYSIYLFHGVVLYGVRLGLNAFGLWDPSRGLANYALQTVLVLIITWCLAAVVYRFVEIPGIDLGRRVAARFKHKREYPA